MQKKPQVPLVRVHTQKTHTGNILMHHHEASEFLIKYYKIKMCPSPFNVSSLVGRPFHLNIKEISNKVTKNMVKIGCTPGWPKSRRWGWSSTGGIEPGGIGEISSPIRHPCLSKKQSFKTVVPCFVQMGPRLKQKLAIIMAKLCKM